MTKLMDELFAHVSYDTTGSNWRNNPDSEPPEDGVESVDVAEDFNPNHDPKDGEFAESGGSSAGKSLPRAQLKKSVEDTPEFKKWFGASKVVHENGTPMIMFHGTGANFDKFQKRVGDVGIHFGTAGQADDRLDYQRERKIKTEQGMNIMPVYLSITNPLRLPDCGAWNPDNMVFQLQKLFPNSDISQTGNKWVESEKRWKPVNIKLKTTKDIREWLQSKGYDGIVYKNTGEVAGASQLRQDAMFDADKDAELKKYIDEHAEDSYIAFESNQIKSAIGNKGTFSSKSKVITDSELGEDADFNEAQHPRGQPKNAGQFAKSDSAVKEGASKLSSLPQSKLDNMDWPQIHDFVEQHKLGNVGNAAYNLHEARKLTPKPSDKLKKVTESNTWSLSNEFDYVANVDGHHYGVSKYEDPDADEDNDEDYVWAFKPLDENTITMHTTSTSDKDELFKEMREHNQKTGRGEQAQKSHSKVLFEVAPDPHDEELTTRWNKIDEHTRAVISSEVLDGILPEVQEKLGADEPLQVTKHVQYGGYLDNTNPSLSLLLGKSVTNAQAAMLTRVLGSALTQDSMMRVSEKPFTGSTEMGTVIVRVPADIGYKAVESMYNKLRQSVLDGDGKPLINGHTTDDGSMVILVDTGSEEAIHNQVLKVLGDKYEVGHGKLQVAWPEKGDDDYGFTGEDKTVRGKSESSVQQWVHSVRTRATEDLKHRIEQYETEHKG